MQSDAENIKKLSLKEGTSMMSTYHFQVYNFSIYYTLW